MPISKSSRTQRKLLIRHEGVLYQFGKLSMTKDGSVVWNSPKHKREQPTHSHLQRATMGEVIRLYYGRKPLESELVDHVSFHGSGQIHQREQVTEKKKVVLYTPPLRDLRSPVPVCTVVPEKLTEPFQKKLSKHDLVWEFKKPFGGYAFCLMAIPKDFPVALYFSQFPGEGERSNCTWQMQYYNLAIMGFTLKSFVGAPWMTLKIYPVQNRFPFVFTMNDEYLELQYGAIRIAYLPVIDSIKRKIFLQSRELMSVT